MCSKGLIAQSRTPDELAGVIAHEIGHVAHRDGTRSILQAAGLSFLFGMLLGDFTGGGVVVIAAQTVMQSAYSRDVESAADRYGVELMTKIGGDGRALGTILERIAGGIEPGMTILRDHPATMERVAVDQFHRAEAQWPAAHRRGRLGGAQADLQLKHDAIRSNLHPPTQSSRRRPGCRSRSRTHLAARPLSRHGPSEIQARCSDGHGPALSLFNRETADIGVRR